MKIKLTYGRGYKTINVPDDGTTIITSKQMPALADEASVIQHALRNPIGTPPLRELVNSDDSVAIVPADEVRSALTQAV